MSELDTVAGLGAETMGAGIGRGLYDYTQETA